MQRSKRVVWKMIFGVLTGLLLAGLLAGCQTKAEPKGVEKKYYRPKVLRIGLIPNIAPEKQKANYEPFGKYMEKKMGMPVELFVATNYAGVVQAMVSGQLDLAYFGGLTYAQALEQVPVEPIVTEIDRETGTREYWSLIITRPDSGINSPKDLKGRTFAFGDPSSTSGSLFPRIMLVEAGYDWRSEFTPIKQVIYTGGHDATAEAVVTGKVDAGGIEGRILNRLIKEGKVDGSKIKIVAKRLVLGYPWCVRKDLDPKLKKKIVDAFKAIDDPALLDLMRAKRYVEVSEKDYTYIRNKAKELGLVKTKK
ncbi:MAG: phosphate/phosphite/phosphonate ABC transporter substrate-binding protein [Actinomycetota bacterium]